MLRYVCMYLCMCQRKRARIPSMRQAVKRTSILSPLQQFFLIFYFCAALDLNNKEFMHTQINKSQSPVNKSLCSCMHMDICLTIAGQPLGGAPKDPQSHSFEYLSVVSVHHLHVCTYVCMCVCAFSVLSATSMKTSLPSILLHFYYVFAYFFVLVFALRCGMWLCALWLEVNVVTKGKRCPNNSLKTVSCYVCIFG